MNQFKYIGSSVGNCAGVAGCEHTPDYLKSRLNLEEKWIETIHIKSNKKGLQAIDDLQIFSITLAETTAKLSAKNQKFINIGGDHSMGIGTWSGVSETVGDFGLLWIDAHMDAHTPETSPSKNVHGMPVASLLGYGDDRLTKVLNVNPKMKPENIVLIGIRSYEPEEEEFLNKMGVKVLKMENLESSELPNIVNHEIGIFKSRGLKTGISFDLDVIDPSEFVAFGTPVKNGFKSKDCLDMFASLDKANILGIEFVEYNKKIDKKQKGLEFLNLALNILG